ncbi:MAG: tRNA lysidine(34) synthetase TilS [Candidatus Methylomirabilales bacterium]
MKLLQKVRQAIHQHTLFGRGDLILVAVSGGPDSVALLHVLGALQDPMGFRLHVGHFDHHLRPEASEGEVAVVRRMAEGLGLPVTVARWEAPTLTGSIQARAREARYRFLDQVARDIGAVRIALAHTRDDQAETLLLNLFRGSGLRGLRGMLFARDGRYVRPFLDVGREEVEGYVAAQGLQVLRDPSNQDRRFRRVRVRHELIPYLQRVFNPAISTVLARTAASIARDEAYLTECADRAYGAIARPVPEGVRLPLPDLRRLPPAIRLRLFLRAVRELVPRGGLDTVHLEALESGLLRGARGAGRLTLPGGLEARWDREQVTVGRERPGEAVPPTEVPVPGTIEIRALRVRVQTVVVPGGLRAAPILELGRALLPWGRLCPPLVLRSWRPGDRLSPLGLGGSKKLQDLFVDAGVPRGKRSRVPILCDQRGILWVVGHRLDERGRLEVGEAPCLAVTVESI